MSDTNRDYCGIIFIGGGSSWAWGSSPEIVTKNAVKYCMQDWKSFYKFEKGSTFKVNIYDMKNRSGWYADERGVHDETTHEVLKAHSVVSVTL